MQWLDILKNKKQIHYFSNRTVDKQLIVDILDELHEYCPSKQNKTPYTIKVVPSEGNESLKEAIFYNTWCDSPSPSDPRNTQVLAPYTFLFKTTTLEPIGMIEIGIASTFIAYAAISRGLSIGFCECYKKDDIDLMLGIGYPIVGDETFYHPLQKKKKQHHFEEEGPKKQDSSEYILWV